MAMSAPSDKKSRVTLSEINVTPLVDVMLVLLIIFMVTAPMMQQGIKVDLPETAGSGSAANEDPFVLVIDKNKRISAGTATLPFDQLRTKLNAIFSTRNNKELYIQADRHVEYGIVAEVMAEARAAGITQMSLITVPKSQ